MGIILFNVYLQNNQGEFLIYEFPSPNGDYFI